MKKVIEFAFNIIERVERTAVSIKFQHGASFNLKMNDEVKGVVMVKHYEFRLTDVNGDLIAKAFLQVDSRLKSSERGWEVHVGDQDTYVITDKKGGIVSPAHEFDEIGLLFDNIIDLCKSRYVGIILK
ncbi:MAG: hypothetical protein LBL47_00145 [Lactobacillus sp.]|jgi:hypothetical protein|nr:hypothetical protein [Lactobacillus sp.]